MLKGEFREILIEVTIDNYDVETIDWRKAWKAEEKV